jgi:queuine/archaeosine tRNA-ribosyltransferase
MKTLCDSGGFHVSYLSHFVKLSFNSVAFASSEAYLYIFVSSSNGVMLKVGTGECGTQ